MPQQDWFTQNAYKSPAAEPVDWFTANSLQIAAPVAPSHPMARFGNLVTDVGTGIVKGAGQTAANLGRLVHKVPGFSEGLDAIYGRPGLSQAAFSAADETLKPQGTAQSIGKGAEQIAEFFMPAGVAEMAATKIASAVPRLGALGGRVVAQGAAAGAVTAAQRGDPILGAALGAAGPVAGKVIKAAAPRLVAAAEKQVIRALGPTKERFKAIAEKLAPKILARGLRGSREGLLEKAATALETSGQQIDDALQQFGARQVGTQPLVDALETSKDAFRTTVQKPVGAAMAAGQAGATSAVGPNGLASVVVEYEPRAIKQLDKLQGVITALGPDARVDQLVAVRRAWDKVVADAGGFSHRAPGAIGVPLKDTTEAWAKREATGAIRKLLDAEVPELTALNKEYAFWKGLDDVLTQTMKRTQPQGPGLAREVAGAAGAAAGSGHGIGAAVALQKVGKMANMLFTSPRWRLASAQMKDALAQSIIGGNPSQMAMTLSKISAGLASQATKRPAEVWLTMR